MPSISDPLVRRIRNALLDRLAGHMRLGIIPDARQAADKFIEVMGLLGIEGFKHERIANVIARRAGQQGDY